jgi:hypothetical protein
MAKAGFLFYVLQRQEGRSGVFVAEVRLVSQLVRQTVVVAVVVSCVIIGGGDAAAGCCAQGHRARDRVLVSTSAATGEFEG